MGLMRSVGLSVGLFGVAMLLSSHARAAGEASAPSASGQPLPVGTAAFPPAPVGDPAFPSATAGEPACARPAEPRDSPGSEDVASFEQLAERHAKLLALVRWLNEPPALRAFEEAAAREVRRLAFMRRLIAEREQESEQEFGDRLSLFLRKRAF